jgi:nicotinate-nucleotide adenylyltransferase
LTVGRVVGRVGVLGGTFDPVHLGHLLAAEAVREELDLDSVLFVPARTPPHKLGVPMAPVEDRLAMLEQAIADNPAFATNRVDLDRPGPHYTVDMLDLVRAGFGLAPGDGLWMVVGADSLADLPTWRDPPGIIARARLAVVGRPGHAPDLAPLERVIPGLGDRVDFVPMPLVGISGTDIRHRIALGRSIRYQVPRAVERYVRERGVYRGG